MNINMGDLKNHNKSAATVDTRMSLRSKNGTPNKLLIDNSKVLNENRNTLNIMTKASE